MQDEDVKKVDGTEGEEVVVATDEVVNADAEVSTEEEVVAQEPADENAEVAEVATDEIVA
ncbi:hypothetical protein A3J61_00520 [Candidatus Nomurabacteria bacterium RIFCSPHIGHO2_02_FULL_38_15]|uniref:Uncharacterized protein n=1 Tax=Candidatus Nomurabacteria bacterium RIFCSPHIGHO2_02_FULL_38_15 TaxID=1801752 RepID=A0A1F6VQP0_9BACT|nr:MAG: hypothetical protein A3J61_00520 [Candidatus Nomurabacteria bacterium RIFCSPHIGHO2_02_FULL_38_15]